MSEAQLLAPVLAFASTHRTHRGNVHRLNEDAVLDRSEAGLWMVADGTGAHEAGDYASQAIATALRTIEFKTQHKLVDRIDRVEDVLLQVNTMLHDYGKTQFAGATVGSNVVVFIAAGDFGVALWAGDSRLYRFRAGTLEQVATQSADLRFHFSQFITHRVQGSFYFLGARARLLGFSNQIDHQLIQVFLRRTSA